tara:strand:- start:16 stop:744 length:729 start_codon:yes stop_codon:yes gene_type:complete
MSQNDLVIDNQTFPATRADINSALQALGSTNSGSTAPATTYANMLWYDTSNNILKMRAEANDAWISIGYLNQSTDTFSLFDDIQTVDTLGVQTGLLGDQATVTWEGGTGTLQSLVSPANVAAAIAALTPVPPTPIGVGQTWAAVTLTKGTVYRNQTGRPIQMVANLYAGSTSNPSGNFTGSASFSLSVDDVTYLTVGSVETSQGTSNRNSLTVTLPDDYYYKWDGTTGTYSYLGNASFVKLS